MTAQDDKLIQPPEFALEKEQILALAAEEHDPIAILEKIYQLWWHWADFHLFIISPTIMPVSPPIVIPPAPLIEAGELEFVYDIYDHGYKLSTSKGKEMYVSGMSMCKLYYTVEKMVYLLVDRLKSGGIDKETEVQIAFGGHELAQRKGFESIINLSYNVVVTNFDPGSWGDRYLQRAKLMAEKGYGYPPEAPRDIYRHSHAASHRTKPA